MADLYHLKPQLTPQRYLSSLLSHPKPYRGVLFPKDDPVLLEFDSKPGMTCVPKMYPTKDGFVKVRYSFVSGPDAAIHRGIDVVYFVDQAKPRSIFGAVRFGLRASSIILPSYNYAATAHGGAVESVLDDITGTVVRHCQSVWMATSDFSAKLKKPAPLMETLKFEASVESAEKNGLYAMTRGKIFRPSGEIVAEGSAKMVDLDVLRRMMTR
jgi:acyl-coenzyme A thioesterase PaaI-like protein